VGQMEGVWRRDETKGRPVLVTWHSKKGWMGSESPGDAQRRGDGLRCSVMEGLELAEGLALSRRVFVASESGSLGGTLFYCKGNRREPAEGLACSPGIQSKYIRD